MKKVVRLVVTLLFVSFFLCSSVVLAEDTIKIGVQAPITGQFAYEGQGMVKASTLIIEQLNAKGGILGKKLELFTCDDEGAPMKAAICAKDLVSKGAVAVVGAYTSACAMAIQETYQRANVTFASATSNNDLTERGFWTFIRSCIPNEAHSAFAAEYM
ncbi:MAG: ABC transporter substrate-binding protein, partial [Deltaproteobacteria bacterium]|nr:ABC transporter substrate-binding protein [Deltaproteobacteria bacterium]